MRLQSAVHVQIPSVSGGLDEPAPEKPDLQALIDVYFAEFTRVVGTRPRFSGKDGKLLKALLASQGFDTVHEAIVALFASRDEFLQRSGYSIGVLSSQFNKLLVGLRRAPPVQARALGPSYASDWYAECHHEPKCETQAAHAMRLKLDAVKGASSGQVKRLAS